MGINYCFLQQFIAFQRHKLFVLIVSNDFATAILHKLLSFACLSQDKLNSPCCC